MNELLPNLIFFAGAGQLCVLVASALVPIRLNWRQEMLVLPRLHRQLYWTYGGYVVLSIFSLGMISLFNAQELASGSRLARSFCVYGALFWGIRLGLQAVFDVKPHLTRWWLVAGYHTLTLLFLSFVVTYAWGAVYQLH